MIACIDTICTLNDWIIILLICGIGGLSLLIYDLLKNKNGVRM